MRFPSLDQVKERKMGRWALAYLAGAWLVLQVVTVLGGTYAWPGWLLRAVPVVLGVGFFVALVVAWYHGEQGRQRASGVELGILTALLAIAGLGVMIVGDGDGAPMAAVVEAAGGAGTTDGGTVPVLEEVPIEETSIAVLPFDNMSADPEQEYFSDGLTEELLNALARVEGLRVAASTSAFAFKGADVSADSIGRALRVAHLVEGSVRRAGDRVRISARLVDAETGFREWGESYDRELTDVFAVQDEIGRAIAEELRVRVGARPLAERGTADAEAYALVLKGRQTLRTQGGPAEEWLREAEASFEAALARDSAYARAWAGLAAIYKDRAYRGLAPESAWERARATAERALALDPEEGTAHSVLSVIAEFYDQDFEAARAHLKRALEANPSSAGALALLGWNFMRAGRRAEALRAADRAVTLDPLSVGVLNNAAAIYNYAREPERAVELFRAALALVPDNAVVLANLALTLPESGEYEEAIDAAERALEMDPDAAFARGILPYAYAKAGRREAALRALEDVPEDAYYFRAMTSSAFGDKDRTFELLERSVEAKEPHVADLGMDPTFDGLRGDPRMDALLERLGVEGVVPG